MVNPVRSAQKAKMVPQEPKVTKEIRVLLVLRVLRPRWSAPLVLMALTGIKAHVGDRVHQELKVLPASMVMTESKAQMVNKVLVGRKVSKVVKDRKAQLVIMAPWVCPARKEI